MKPTSATMRLYTTDEDEAIVTLIARPHRNYQWRFLTMFAQGLQRLSKLDRPSVYYRVLFHALSVLDPVQWRHMTAREVAEATGMSLISAQRASAMLRMDKVLMEKGKGAALRMRLNNQIAWASTSEKHNQATPDLEIRDAR